MALVSVLNTLINGLYDVKNVSHILLHESI